MARDLDHLVWAAPDLEAAVEEFTERSGIRPTPGGQHLGLGTRNYLAALGEDALGSDLGGGSSGDSASEQYLEIIGPDPDQPTPARPRPFSIDRLDSPRLVAWAVKADRLNEQVEAARKAGWDPGNAVAMSRERPDGVLLEWELTIRRSTETGDGETDVVAPVPFLIDWGSTISPARSAVRGARLLALRAGHPDPERLRAQLLAVGAVLGVECSAAPSLSARIDSPRGEFVLD